MPVPSRKILLADDSVTIQKVVNLTFAEEGIEVITTDDGDTALARIWEDRPDVVLADVNMPGATGYQVCEALRRTEATQHIPVILLVGSFEPFDEAEASRVGANAYLTKPFHSIRQLIDQVQALMPENGEEPAAQEQPAGPPDDIETLYERSLSEPEADETASTREYEFGDQGMDDDLIETEQIGTEVQQVEPISGGFDETFENVHDEQIEQPAETRFDSETETFEPEQRFAPEPEPFGGEPYRPEPEPVEYDEAPAGFESFGVNQESPMADLEQPADAVQDVSPFDETVSFDGGIEQFQPAQESAGETQEYQPPHAGEQEPPQEPAFEQPYQPGHFVPETFSKETAEASFEENPYQATTEEFRTSQAGIEPTFGETESLSREELELLELPPSDDNQTVELTTPERAELMGGDKQIVTISPELMEEIVQKVVERLSSKY